MKFDGETTKQFQLYKARYVVYMESGNLELNFNKNVISTIDESISLGELIERLSKLHEELSLMVQGHVNLKSLDKYRVDLINKKLIKSKDPGVLAFTGCCLSDILRLYAPDAPFTDLELTDIFKLFINQFRYLTDQDNGYYIQQTYIITRLVEYRSVVLVTDLPQSSKLIEEIFQVFYDKEKSNFQSKLTKIIGTLLGEIITECDTISTTILKFIFNKFLTYNPNSGVKGLHVSKDICFEFSLVICQNYTNRLSRYLTKFYSEILYEVTGDNQNELLTSTLDAPFKTLTKLHKLVANIWSYVPELVGSVIGFVYQELSSDNIPLRMSATKLVGDILALNSELNFVTTHNDTYKIWVSKIVDISSKVRIEWVKSIPKILMVRDDVSQDICKGLTKTLIDSDENVRLESIETFGELSTERIWSCIHDVTLYRELLQLTREKTKIVRERCIDIVTSFYSESLKSISREHTNIEIWEEVDKIPSTIFKLYYINDLNINYQVDAVVFDKLLPLEPNDEVRLISLLRAMDKFDQKAFSSFYAFNKRQHQMSTVMTKFIEFCEKKNLTSEVNFDIKTKLEKTIQWLDSTLPPQIDNISILDKLVELNDKRIYHLIKTGVKQCVPYLTMKNAINELFTRLKDDDLFRKKNIRIGSSFTRETFFSIIKILIYRSAPLIYNVSIIPLLLDNKVATKEHEIYLKRQLLDNITNVTPTIFKDQIELFKNLIKQPSHEGINNTSSVTIGEALNTIYKIYKSIKDGLDFQDKIFWTRLEELAVKGDTYESRYSIKLLSLSPLRDEYMIRIKNMILPLCLKKSNRFSTDILVLAEIFKYNPSVLNEDSSEIVGYLIKNVLLTNQVTQNSEKGSEWIDNNKLLLQDYEPLASKLYSLKLFANKLKSISDDIEHDELAQQFTVKTIKLFFYLISSGGELVSEDKGNYPTQTNYQMRLRCYAGLQILKISKIPALHKFIRPQDVGKLVNLIEDESLNVRNTFLDYLKHYIANEFISIKFLPLIFFMAYEPDIHLKSETKTWINFTVNKESFKRGAFFERALPRVIHCISHHPDIINGIHIDNNLFLNNLTTAIDYLVFYFDSIATLDNISLLYYLAGRIKQYRDAVLEEDIEANEQKEDQNNFIFNNIYVISELAQLILSELKDQRNWNLPVYPGKLNLPSDLFEPFPTMDAAQKNTFISYIPDNKLNDLKSSIRLKVSRITNASQTHKQLTQKKKLNNDYKNIKVKQSTKRKQRKFDEDGESNSDSDAEEYKPNKENSIGVKKRFIRQQRQIDYNERNDDEE